MKQVQSWLEDIYSNEMSNSQDLKLAVAGVIVEEMRQKVYEQTSFRCSAGISHNKVSSKFSNIR